MADVFTKAKRSDVMSRIHGRGNKETEGMLAKLLRKADINGWRRHLPLFGKPDFTFSKSRLTIFVDGCFWHGCPRHSNIPATNRAFWKHKLKANKIRDLLVTKTLRQGGWRVLRLWEHQLSGKNGVRCVQRIQGMLSHSQGKIKSR